MVLFYCKKINCGALLTIEIFSIFFTATFGFTRVNNLEENSRNRVKRDGLVFFQDSRCPKGKFYCQSGECIEGDQLCDGHANCKTRDDEVEDLCKYNSCPKDKFQCDYGACLNKSQTCDGFLNCRNGADEADELCHANKCASDLFECGNGICLKKSQLCDGQPNCRNGADEKPELCKKNNCPKDRFKCPEGVCLKTQQLCDGFENCQNGADEEPKLCLNRTCPKNTFRCDYGGCIGKIQLCDGNPNCRDGSDETDELCRYNICPDGLFRCDYGACLRQDMVCDGKPNCRNGADEAPERCRRDNPTITISLINSCTLPPQTTDKKYSVKCRDEQTCANKPGEKVPELTNLLLRCNLGYGYDQMSSTAYCINGSWVPSIGKCKKICKKLEPENVELTCYRSRTGLSIPCNGSLVEGTLVRMQCLPHFHSETPVQYSEITCKSSGWSEPLYKCVADCGQPYSPSLKLISNGSEDQFGASPWNVAVYDVSESKNPIQICGGTIISENLIVSAAHCFYDENSKKLFNNRRFEIAVAKIKRSHSVKDNPQTAFYKIREIILSDSGYNGPLTNYAADIAILRTETKINISAVVLPACVDFDNRQMFNPGKRKPGKLVGWGLDSKNNPSDVLLTADLPFISRSECLKMVSPDFQSSITIDKFCAGSTNSSGSGAKPGDSGGGLIYREPQSALYYLRGIVSIKDPSSSSAIAAFTDMSFYIDWINKIRNKIENIKK